MPGVVFSRGDRITLRTIESEDAAIVQRARNEPAFREGFRVETPTTRNMVEGYIEETSRSGRLASLTAHFVRRSP